MIWRTLLAFWIALTLSACAATMQDRSVRAEHTKRIALTFDDTPRHPGSLIASEDERAERIIAALGSKQAAFFINPGKIAERPGAEQRIARYVAAGHVIANHTNTHPSLHQTATADYIAEIDAAEAWLKGREGYRPWFRFPFLHEGGRDIAKRDAVRTALAERGLRNGYVTVDGSDWFYDDAVTQAYEAGQEVDLEALGDLFVETHLQSAEFTQRLSIDTLDRAPVQVMLLHEADVTALFLVDLIAALEARGWTIISADEAFADPIAKLQPDVPATQGNLMEMLARPARAALV